MSVPQEILAGLRGREGRLHTPPPRAARLAFPRLMLLALLSAALCALLTSCLHVHGVLQREVATESAFVNAVVRRTGSASVFHGRREGGPASLLAALRRPGVHEAHVLSLAGEVIASDDAGLAGSRRTGDAVVERALRGEGVARTGAWLWSTPLPLAYLAAAGPPSLELVVPVFNESGSSVIGAVAFTRAPGPGLSAAGAIVSTIWTAYLVATAVLYAALHVLLRRGTVREGWTRTWGPLTDPRQPWLDVESELRARAAFRRIAVRGYADPALPHLAIAPGLLGVVLRAFAAHALESAANGDILLLQVRTIAQGVEFAYAIPGAARPGFLAATQASRATAALACAVDDAGGALAILDQADRGPRVVVTLPA